MSGHPPAKRVRLAAMHELLVDGEVVWVGAVERVGWRSTWLLQPWSLV